MKTVFKLFLAMASSVAGVTASAMTADPFGYGRQNAIQIEPAAWLIDRPYYMINNEPYWIVSYSADEKHNTPIDDAVCKGLGFAFSRDGSREQAIGKEVFGSQLNYNYVVFNEAGQIARVIREATSIVTAIYWKALICEQQ